MTPRATARIEPITVYQYDRTLHVDVKRTVGFRYECECGESGPRRASVSAARHTLREHRDDRHGGRSW